MTTIQKDKLQLPPKNGTAKVKTKQVDKFRRQNGGGQELPRTEITNATNQGETRRHLTIDKFGR